MNMLDYFETMLHWSPSSTFGGAMHGCCPFHHDTHPSFHIYLKNTPPSFHCFSPACGADGSGLYGAIRWAEFGGVDEKEAIAKRKRELGGDSQDPYIWKGISTPYRQEEREIDLRRLPTQEEQLCMTVAHQWWVHQLFGNAHRDIRAYVRSRGLSLDFVEATKTVGYAPFCRPDSATYRSLSKALADVCGPNWLTVATSIGVFARESDAHARMHDRLIFSQVDPDTGLVQLFLGRAMKEGSTHKWLLPYDVRKVPFSVPVEHPVLPGTTIMEAPIEALVLAQPAPGFTGIRNVAQIGNSTIPMSYLKQLEQPLFVAFNNDASPEKGERMAQKLMARLLKEGIAHYRVMVPTPEDKDIDNFVKRHGSILRWVECYPQEVAIAI